MRGGGGLIDGVRQVPRKTRAYLWRGGGGEMQYAVQSHLNKYNFQIQWIILQLQISQLKNTQALSDFWHWGHNWDLECEAKVN